MRGLRRRRLLAALALPALAAAGRASGASLVDIVATAKLSVLPLGTWRDTDNPRFGFRGSAFAVGDGTLVATNFHVLPEGAEASGAPRLVVLANRARGGAADVRTVKVVATDRARDLALLRLDGGVPLPPLALEDKKAARDGQSIALMGFPIGGVFGYATVTHRGIVAAVTTVALPAPTAQSLDPRAVLRMREGNFEVLQLDATAYPGNSGGPVLDADTGRVLGVVNMVLVKGSRESALASPTGITYAIPVAHLIALMADVPR